MRQRLLAYLVVVPVVTLAAAIVVLLFIENSLIFFPVKGNVGKSPGEDVYVTTSDKVRIHGWYVANPEAKLTLLWFHGNAGNLEDRREWLQGLRRR